MFAVLRRWQVSAAAAALGAAVYGFSPALVHSAIGHYDLQFAVFPPLIGVLVALAGYPLWIQFFGPLGQAGSPFTPDFYKNDLSGFVVPSSYLLFHTAGSAVEALRYQGQLPEYLGYLGWPLIAVLAAGAVRFWRRLPVRACAVACLVLLVFSTVLTVPVPMSTFTEPLRWQADTGQPGTLVGGYFMGPADNGRAYTDGAGLPQAGRYLNLLWAESGAGLPGALASAGPASADPSSPDYVRIAAVSPGAMRAQIAAWHTTAVVAVTLRGTPVYAYLAALLGPPAVVIGDVMAWRT
jgi:hypothetical protein